MHKFICSLLALSLVVYSTPLRADDYDNAQEEHFDPANDDQALENDFANQKQQETLLTPTEPQAQETPAPADSGNYADQETLVGPENPVETQKRNRLWKNIALAVVAVAVAVTALLLVNSNQGHHKKHDK